jgi:hypothetical protein
MSEIDTATINGLSRKLDVIIRILLHFANKDADFNDGKQTTGDLAVLLKKHGLSYAEIAAILDSPVESIRVLVHLKGRAGKKMTKAK